MKTRTRPLLVALVAAALAASTPARGQDAWDAFSPDDEGFAVLTPGAPAAAQQQQQLHAGELKAEGRRYEAKGDGGATYLVLSLKDTGGANEQMADGGASVSFHRASPYLDAIAELAWDVLVRPEVERLREQGKTDVYPSLSYRREFELSGKPAREYLLGLEKAGGRVYVCADGPRIYVVAAFGPDPLSPGLKQFVDSFALGTRTPATPPAETKAVPAAELGGGVGPGRGANTPGGVAPGGGDGPVDYSRPFRPSELASRARVTSKPEPLYTESARKFRVTGTVTLRVVLASTGEVERISIITRLPHGLTARAVEATRQVKFVPAEKDGRRVSQYATFQYNFNIY